MVFNIYFKLFWFFDLSSSPSINFPQIPVENNTEQSIGQTNNKSHDIEINARNAAKEENRKSGENGRSRDWNWDIGIKIEIINF